MILLEKKILPFRFFAGTSMQGLSYLEKVTLRIKKGVYLMIFWCQIILNNLLANPPMCEMTDLNLV